MTKTIRVIPIKFRWLRRRTNEMVYDLNTEVFSDGSFGTTEDSEWTVFAGKSISLSDKNGKEYFTGDIVNAGQDENFVISYFEDTASYVGLGVKTGKTRWIENRENFRGEFQINLLESEIIGNINQNPELL